MLNVPHQATQCRLTLGRTPVLAEHRFVANVRKAKQQDAVPEEDPEVEGVEQLHNREDAGGELSLGSDFNSSSNTRAKIKLFPSKMNAAKLYIE